MAMPVFECQSKSCALNLHAILLLARFLWLTTMLLSSLLLLAASTVLYDLGNMQWMFTMWMNWVHSQISRYVSANFCFACFLRSGMGWEGFSRLSSLYTVLFVLLKRCCTPLFCLSLLFYILYPVISSFPSAQLLHICPCSKCVTRLDISAGY